MPKKSSAPATAQAKVAAPTSPKKLRIPLEENGIQVNFCKNPSCTNFGIPASQTLLRGILGQANPYTVVAAGAGYPHLRCNACREHIPIKSNLGVVEEIQRLQKEIAGPAEPSCPRRCVNNGKPVSAGKAFYSSFGKTAIGSPRWKCKACTNTFSVALKSTHRQREAHKNALIFKLLLGKMPLQRIIELAEISPKTLYDKINFIYAQCLAFSGERERGLRNLYTPRLYLGVDRQVYTVNWWRRSDRRNVLLTAVVAADNLTHYVFGAALNFDSSLDASEVEKEALAAGDSKKSAPYRRHARLWTVADYAAAVAKSAVVPTGNGLQDSITETYVTAELRDDIESPDKPSSDDKLPNKGMQTHSEYTLYGFFFYLKSLFPHVEKVRFFLDQDSGIRAACLAAFKEEIIARKADVFFVRTNKTMTVEAKRNVSQAAQRDVAAVQKTQPNLTKNDVITLMMKQRLQAMSHIGKWRDAWVLHPMPNMSEPEKALCYLTNFGDYDIDHLARLYNKGSLHSVDSFFNRVRRRVSLLERSVGSHGNAGRQWDGYAPYSPQQVQKLITIFKTVHNYVLVSKQDSKTPAMRLGLAKAPITYDDILRFV